MYARLRAVLFAVPAETAHRATIAAALTRAPGKLRIDARALALRGDRDHGEQLVARPRDEQLQLRMLVDRPERAERRRAAAPLAEAFGPELHEPA